MAKAIWRMALALISATAVAACSPTGPDPASVTDSGAAGRSTLTWTIEDGCSDGLGLYVRFFDADGLNVWPSSTEVYTTTAGGSVSRTLSCTTGNKVCYGAKPADPGSSYFWGLGITGDAGCDTCCVTCQTTTPQPRRLSCG